MQVAWGKRLAVEAQGKGRYMLMKTLLLVCVVGLKQADCSVHTAEAVIQGPDAQSFVECGLHGQAYIAGGALAGYLNGEHYLKVACMAGQPSWSAAATLH